MLPIDNRLAAVDIVEVILVLIVLMLLLDSSLETALETAVFTVFLGLKLNMVEKSLSTGFIKVRTGTLMSMPETHPKKEKNV